MTTTPPTTTALADAEDVLGHGGVDGLLQYAAGQADDADQLRVLLDQANASSLRAFTERDEARRDAGAERAGHAGALALLEDTEQALADVRALVRQHRDGSHPPYLDAIYRAAGGQD